MPELDDKQTQQLIWLHLCLLGIKSSPKVLVGTSGNGCKTAYGLVKDIGPIKVVEQNVNTNSIYAEAARNGWKIAWPMYEQGGYVGPVLIYEADKVYLLTKDQAKQMIANKRQVQNVE